MRIREATEQDWAAIWPFLQRITAAGDTFTYPTDLDHDSARDLWMLPPPARVVVAEDEDGTVLGTAKSYANQAGPGSHVASASYMVDPDRHGRGVGRALCQDTLRWAREQGFHGVQFNAVAETNVHAVHLYRSLGYEIVGRVPGAFHHPAKGYVDLLVMYHRF
ncbi:N-acetyltransferase [Streptomyces sp. NPDC005438]|uniref:GNAT family N-acetyltransferase n=1 Tax=Streptomyces sp. NPDC005438 TaxID=3156880 RepID=UPI0033A0C8DF